MIRTNVFSDHSFMWRAICLAALVAPSFASGCRDGDRSPVRSSGLTVEQPSPKNQHLGPPLTVTDHLGRRMSFDEAPRRIVSLTPSITEILYEIGAGGLLVGATKYCNYPPEAADLPRVGGGTLESLNHERIIALQPDLVLCKGDIHEPLITTLDRLGIPALALGSDTLAELYDEIRVLGSVAGTSRQAAALVVSMRRRVDAVAKGIPSGEGPKVFYQVWDEPLMTAGPDSFIGELLTIAGARNVLQGTAIRFPKVNPEVVIAENPDVILAPSTHATPVTLESILSRSGWADVRAIRDKRVHLIDGDQISRCGPRVVDALEEIARMLYPNRFPPASADGQPSDYATQARGTQP